MPAADAALLATVETEMARAETALSEIVPATPAVILTTLPGVGVIRPSTYGSAIGDPWRFPDAAAAYRASGLVPSNTSRPENAAAASTSGREGSVLLRKAIIELG